MKRKKGMGTVYEEIKAYLSSKNIKQAEEITSWLKDYSKKTGWPLNGLISAYIHVGTEEGDQDVKTWYAKVLRGLLPKSGEQAWHFVLCHLQCNGLMDLVEFSLAEESGDKGDLLKELAKQISRDDNLLIIGETGTSKQLVAEAIHEMSKRTGKPFLDINCVALPENLLESELFGHEKGAFTGADRLKKGKIEKANGGTVYLDELGKMPERLQAKLLKVIEQKKVQRVGGTDDIYVDVRFLAAAQPEDLEKKIITPDLSWRLQNRIVMPPLRKRMKAAPRSVISSSLNYVCKDLLGPDKRLGVSSEAIETLAMWRYPGNYRELEGILRAASQDVIFDGRDTIQVEDIKHQIHKSNSDFSNYILRQSGGRSLLESKIADVGNHEEVRLRDIIGYAEDVASKIIESKVRAIIQSGRSLKSVLLEEGVSKREYFNYYTKLTKRAGKVKELKKTDI